METTATQDEGVDQAPATKPLAGPKGIGGWLILPIIHLIGSIIFTGINLWPVLQNKGYIIDFALDPTYRWMLLPMSISAGLGAAILALAGAALVMLCLKRRIFRVLMICFYLLVLVTTIFETSLVFAFENSERRLRMSRKWPRNFSAALWLR